MAKGKTPNENEIEKVMAKVDEYDAQTIDVAAGDDPLSQKALNPDTISGNIYGRGPGKGKKKAESK
jgi:hypothetical protein